MKRDFLLLAALGAVLAILGVVPLADHMTQRVLLQCHEISWLEFFRPFKNPPPMDAWGVRPISVFILKIYELAWGSTAAPPGYALFLRSWGIFLWFGWAARAWLQEHGQARYATLAAAASMMIAPTLFTAWYLPEFDTMGAAGVLWAGAVLARSEPLRWPTVVSLLPALGVAFGLKESSALMAFAFLSAGLVTHLVRRERLQAERHLRVLVGATLVWMVLAAPLMMMQNGNSAMAGTWWFDRLPILEHNLDQYIYLLGAPGAALIAAWAGVQALRDRWSQLAWVPPFALAGLLLASPLVVYYSHYEAIYYTPRFFPLGFGLLLCAALAWRWRDNRDIGAKIPRSFFYAMGIYGAALMASPSAREDLASRIFLAMAPLLHALALEAAEGLYRTLREATSPRRLLGLGGTAVLFVSWLWYAPASAFNFTQDWRARQATEFDGRQQLARLELKSALVLFNHYVQLVGAYELMQFGAPDLRRSTEFLQVTAWPGTHRLPDAHWGSRRVLEDLYQEGQLFYLYYLTPHSRMGAEVNAKLVGDLRWTRRPYGLFTPYDYQPGVAVAVPPEDIPVFNGAPAWNRMEETRITTYSSETPFLLWIFQNRGQKLFASARPYLQRPGLITEIPLRLLSDIPIVERYEYQQETWRMLNPRPRPRAAGLPGPATGPGSGPAGPPEGPGPQGGPQGGAPGGPPSGPPNGPPNGPPGGGPP